MTSKHLTVVVHGWEFPVVLFGITQLKHTTYIVCILSVGPQEYGILNHLTVCDRIDQAAL